MTTKTIIMTLLIKRDISDMDFFSSSAMISDTASEFTENFLPYMNLNTRTRIIIMTTTTGAVFLMKSKKLNLAALPIMIFGGSPINVAVPPMLDAKI